MRILTILASIVGVLSLFANIALGYTTYTLNMQKNTLQERLNAQIVDFNAVVSSLNTTKSQLNTTKNQLNETTVELTNARESISTLNTQLDKAKSDSNTYRDRASKAEYFVERAKCKVMVNENKAYAATTNNSIKSAVISALERLYGGTARSSSFTTYWTDDKSALLTALWGEGSTKTVLSWDSSGNLKTVYDVNGGCVMYTR
jgi:chromosome segregation ATPase